jgi:hypothetical protein
MERPFHKIFSPSTASLTASPMSASPVSSLVFCCLSTSFILASKLLVYLVLVLVLVFVYKFCTRL